LKLYRTFTKRIGTSSFIDCGATLVAWGFFYKLVGLYAFIASQINLFKRKSYVPYQHIRGDAKESKGRPQSPLETFALLRLKLVGFAAGVSRLRTRPEGFAVALWTPSHPLLPA